MKNPNSQLAKQSANPYRVNDADMREKLHNTEDDINAVEVFIGALCAIVITCLLAALVFAFSKILDYCCARQHAESNVARSAGLLELSVAERKKILEYMFPSKNYSSTEVPLRGTFADMEDDETRVTCAICLNDYGT